jgi:hypothetical protein
MTLGQRSNGRQLRTWATLIISALAGTKALHDMHRPFEAGIQIQHFIAALIYGLLLSLVSFRSNEIALHVDQSLFFTSLHSPTHRVYARWTCTGAETR